MVRDVFKVWFPTGMVEQAMRLTVYLSRITPNELRHYFAQHGQCYITLLNEREVPEAH